MGRAQTNPGTVLGRTASQQTESLLPRNLFCTFNVYERGRSARNERKLRSRLLRLSSADGRSPATAVALGAGKHWEIWLAKYVFAAH
jgi:hypothetical protein